MAQNDSGRFILAENRRTPKVHGNKAVEEKKYRDHSGHGGLGRRRYQRYCDAFDWVQHCVDQGYFLEAIAILESLLWDRLASRLHHLKKIETKEKGIETRTSFATLCSQLIGDEGNGGKEKDVEFRAAIAEIQRWAKKRNEAVHQIAKVFRSDTSAKEFHAIRKSYQQTANEGIEFLRAFDVLDTQSRASVGRRSATSEYAFFPNERSGASRDRSQGRSLVRVEKTASTLAVADTTSNTGILASPE